MATHETILQVLNWLDLNTDRDLVEERIPLFLQVLADIPDQVLQPAALAYASRSRYFPHPSELRQEALALLADLQPVPSEFEAWAEVQAEIERTGSLGQPEFSHPLIANAVDIFGWQYLCLSSEATLDRAHFFKAYHKLLETHSRQLALPEAVKQYVARGKGEFLLEQGHSQAEGSDNEGDLLQAPGK